MFGQPLLSDNTNCGSPATRETAPGTLARASGKGAWWRRRKGAQGMLELKA